MEGDKMSQCFQQSHEAYAHGDGAAAKALSNQGKVHQANMEQLHKQASQIIYTGQLSPHIHAIHHWSAWVG